MDDQFGNIEWGISIVVSNLKTIWKTNTFIIWLYYRKYA